MELIVKQLNLVFDNAGLVIIFGVALLVLYNKLSNTLSKRIEAQYKTFELKRDIYFKLLESLTGLAATMNVLHGIHEKEVGQKPSEEFKHYTSVLNGYGEKFRNAFARSFIILSDDAISLLKEIDATGSNIASFANDAQIYKKVHSLCSNAVRNITEIANEDLKIEENIK